MIRADKTRINKYKSEYIIKLVGVYINKKWRSMANNIMFGVLPRHNDHFEYQNWNLRTNVSKPNKSILSNLPLYSSFSPGLIKKLVLPTKHLPQRLLQDDSIAIQTVNSSRTQVRTYPPSVFRCYRNNRRTLQPLDYLCPRNLAEIEKRSMSSGTLSN